MKSEIVHSESVVSDIIILNHRAASVFRKFNINYCCSGNITLKEACQLVQADQHLVQKELNDVLRPALLSPTLNLKNWSIDFTIDYLVNIHHAYLYNNLPEITETLQKFVNSHQSRYPYLVQLMDSFLELNRELLPHLEHEEKVIFPYIRQIAHAFDSKEPYAALLVRTLRKPIDTMIHHEHEHIEKYLFTFRGLTDQYNSPSNACATHKVALMKLKELDADLVQHIYLENEILFPKALQIEKELKVHK